MKLPVLLILACAALLLAFLLGGGLGGAIGLVVVPLVPALLLGLSRSGARLALATALLLLAALLSLHALRLFPGSTLWMLVGVGFVPWIVLGWLHARSFEV